MDYSVIATKFGLSKAKTERLMKFAMERIKDEALDLGHCWVGRGAYFKAVSKPPRPYRNPRTGEKGMSSPKTFVTMNAQVA